MSERTLYVASGNAGKLRDFRVAAEALGSGWRLGPLPGLAALEAPEETGATFADNARLKALYYAQFAAGALVVADDSGLEVDSLEGAPGVYSARYADRLGFPARTGWTVDARNNACLLAQLAAAEGDAERPPDRAARYRCVLTAAQGGVVLATGQGTVSGTILREPRGHGGFGYDPLFLVPELGETMAELTPEMRLGLSHRGAALQDLLARLR